METIVRANGVDLCVETFGDPGDPAILLIMGAGASMLWWDEAFCARLAAGPRFVIRYDNRDTGRSTTYEPGAPGYTGDDLVGDAVGLLDALGLAAAHVVGFSMGGGIAQVVALDLPARVASLTLISTSPVFHVDVALPGISDELRAALASPPPLPDWRDRDAVREYMVAIERPYAARSQPFDEAAARERAGRELDRATDIAASLTNPDIVVARGGERDYHGRIEAPTLVLHGTEDPAFPYAHGVALADAIAGAELVGVEAMGHELPARVWDVVVPAVLRHTGRG